MTEGNCPQINSVEDVSIGDEGPTTVFENISREDIVRYAGASGDFNPIHYDDTRARERGHPSVFAQGMFSAGIATRTLRKWFGLKRLTSYRTRFVSKVWPGDTLTVTATVEDITPTKSGDADISIEVTVKNQDDDVVVTGDSTVALSMENR